jgi:hypothetical protein
VFRKCCFVSLFLILCFKMGNKKKIGSRYKVCKKKLNVRKSNSQQGTPRGVSPRPNGETKPLSSSKAKIGPNLEYYKNKTSDLDYEIVVVKKLEQALCEVAVCKFCGHCLRLSTKSLVGLATKYTISCANCKDLCTSFNNCDDIKVKTNKNPECKTMTTLYDLNIKFVYAMRIIGKGYTSAQIVCGMMWIYRLLLLCFLNTRKCYAKPLKLFVKSLWNRQLKKQLL